MQAFLHFFVEKMHFFSIEVHYVKDLLELAAMSYQLSAFSNPVADQRHKANLTCVALYTAQSINAPLAYKPPKRRSL